MMRYLIAIPLPESDSTSFIKLRDSFRHYAPRWKLTLGPHITINRPQDSLVPCEMAIELFSNAPISPSFKMQFSKVEAFIGKRNSAVYFEPESHLPFNNIKSLYQPIADKIVKSGDEGWAFHPHLTLINRLRSEPAQEALNELAHIQSSEASAFKDFSYLLDRVCLYKKENSDEIWHEIAQNSLSVSNAT